MFKLVEFSREWGLDFKYSIYENATLIITFIWGTFYVRVPMLMSDAMADEMCDPCYGISYHNKGLWWNWGNKVWCFRMPWYWEHVRHTILYSNGEVCCDANSCKHPWDSPEEVKETYDYTYTLKSGEVQKRKATIYGEEREWRWRWFKFLPYPRIIRRSISIDFDGEVGEGTGSWKGGTLGCGYDWKEGESQYECLKRMELERKF